MAAQTLTMLNIQVPPELRTAAEAVCSAGQQYMSPQRKLHHHYEMHVMIPLKRGHTVRCSPPSTAVRLLQKFRFSMVLPKARDVNTEHQCKEGITGGDERSPSSTGGPRGRCAGQALR